MTITERIYQMAAGHLETPAIDGTPARRWAWFAELYDHPQWGLGATIPGFHDAGATIGKLCRDTVTGTPDSLKVRWDVLSRLAAIKGAMCPTAEHHAWTAVTNSAIDAHDFLDDLDFGGIEVVSSAFTAIVAAHAGEDAEQIIAKSLEAWAAFQRAPDPILEVRPLPHIGDFVGTVDNLPQRPNSELRAHLPLGVAS
jgi:hypothetical protein